MSGRTENNARIGRLLYKVMTDPAGYPNGMPFWEEMSPGEKYHRAATGIQFAMMLADEGFVEPVRDFGLGGRYGEGDCADLMRHFEGAAAGERAEFERRMALLSAGSSLPSGDRGGSGS